MLTIKTLGEFDILLDGVSLLEGVDAKRGLFLVYLAEEGKALARMDVARLLWPGVEDGTAQANLRSLLLRMRREGLDRFIKATRTTLELDNLHEIDYDAARLRRLTANVAEASVAELFEAADLYQGAYLQNVVLDDYPHLDEWASALRTEMELRAIRAIARVVAQAIQTRQTARVLGCARMLIELMPYDDDSQWLYMQALWIADRLAEALNHYRMYKWRLKEEMGLDVGEKLTQLVRKMTNRQLDSIDALPSNPAPEPRPDNRYFPYIEHPIVGRNDEATRLMMLLDHGNRLITVVGMGGVGKTFFVRSQIDDLKDHFGNAIFFVDLRSAVVNGVHNPQQAVDALLTSISTAMKLMLQPNQPLFDQVTAALGVASTEQCVLVLDNFEAVQPAALTVSDLLQRIPHLTIIVTTRQTLHLSGEAVITLKGLQWTTPANGAANSDAVQYFLACARRQSMSFTVEEDEYPHIESICAQVEGLPLAIELTARQLGFFSLRELAEHLGGDRSLLDGKKGQPADDHHSIWVVLENMWRMLDEEEQQALAQVSVFAGAFHREALTSVVSNNRRVYQALINASLLRLDEPTWFSLHPLVRQFAADKLAADEAAQAEGRRRHAEYFLSLLALGTRFHTRLKLWDSPNLSIVTRCQTDVLAAWGWAVANARWDLLNQAITELSGFLEHRLQSEEIVSLFSALLDCLPPPEARTAPEYRLAGIAAINLGAKTYRTAPQLGIAWFQQAVAALHKAGDAHEEASAYITVSDFSLHLNIPPQEVEAALARAVVLIDKHQLDELRPFTNFGALQIQFLLGNWRGLRDAVSLFIANPSQIRIHMMPFLLISATALNEWEFLSQVLVIYSRSLSVTPRELTMDETPVWFEHYRGYLLAHDGDTEGVIALRESTIGAYTDFLHFLLPSVYGELAHWHLNIGAVDAAEKAAQIALSAARRLVGDSLVQGILHVGAYAWRRGDIDRAERLLRESLEMAQKMYWPMLIFTPLYYLTLIHIDKLPRQLVERILKIGAVSPTMHWVLRPLAQAYLAEQGIEIEDCEREALWATNLAAVNALVAEVKAVIGERR